MFLDFLIFFKVLNFFKAFNRILNRLNFHRKVQGIFRLREILQKIWKDFNNFQNYYSIFLGNSNTFICDKN